jgi:hypothetical protein
MHGGINLIDKRQCFSATVESVADRMATLKLVFFFGGLSYDSGNVRAPPSPKANASPFLPQCEGTGTLVPHVTMGITVAAAEFHCQWSDGLCSADISRLKSVSHIERPRKAQLPYMKIPLQFDYHVTLDG